MLHIVFAGSADFGAKTLQSLIDHPEFCVDHILTNPPRPVGRKQILTKTPIHQLADTAGIPVSTPENRVTLDDFVAKWQAEGKQAPDFLVVIAYGIIISQKVLDWPKIAPVNVHGSILPAYRGASPIQAALLNGDTITGNSYMRMDKGMDTGPVYAISTIPIQPDTTADTLFTNLANLAEKDVANTLLAIASGSLTAQAQTGAFSECGKIQKTDAEVHFAELPAETIINMFRAYYPWPGLFFIDAHGLRHIIRSINFTPRTFSLNQDIILDNGTCWFRCSNNLYFGATSIQPAGKSVLTAAEWFAGFAIQAD